MLPIAEPSRLETFVETCQHDGVELLIIQGPGSREVEELVDELVVGDGTDPQRFVTTMAFSEEPLEEVLAVANLWSLDGEGESRVEVVRF